MKTKTCILFLILFSFLFAGTFAVATDCTALKKTIKSERNLKKKRAMIEDAIIQCPEDPVFNYKYALSLERFRKYDKAISYYQKAILYDPKMGKAYAGMGDVHIYQGQLDSAIEAYRKAVQLLPGNGRAATRLNHLETKRKALNGEILTVSEIIGVLDQRGKISTSTPLLLTGPILQYQIAFARNSNELLDTGIEQLAGIGQALQNEALKESRFEITTHMGTSGSSLTALQNSKIRAQMIKEQLTANFQINPKRIIIIWQGDTMPLGTGLIASGISLDERVDFKHIVE